MTKRSAALKKLAGVAAMAIVMTGAGLGLGSAVAQATPKHPNPVPHLNTPSSDRLDAFLDKKAPNSFLDKVLDRVTGQ